MIKGFVCMSIVFLLLGGLSVVGSGEENQSESLQALIEIKKYIEAQESSVFASENAKGYLLEHLSIAIKFAENGERGKALKEYNRNVYTCLDNYIVDSTVREVLERMTEAYYGTLDVSQSRSGNLGILASTYPQITAATFTNDWNQAYNDSRRVVNFTVNWGDTYDGDAIIYWNSTWNKTNPTQYPFNSGYLGYNGNYQYTITNLPVGNFTNIKIVAFDYVYGSLAWKFAKVHNTEVYDKRIALIICGWGKNQAGYWSPWNDANFTYWTLRSKGFSDDDIYFLYCNGTHLGYTNYYGTIIDGNATRAKIDSTCSTINSISTNNSSIFVMVTTHGNTADNGTAFFAIKKDENYTGDSSGRDEEVWATEFARTSPPSFLGRITNYKRMIITIGSCKSGGFNITKEIQTEKRILITATYSNQLYAWYNWNYEHSNFYYYLISALNGTSPHGNNSVNTRNGWVPIYPEDNTDKDSITSLVEATNWSYQYILYNGRDCLNGDWETQIIGYNDMHNNTGLFPACANSNDFNLPYNDSRIISEGGNNYPFKWQYVGMGGRGLGITLACTPYPLNLLRGDT